MTEAVADDIKLVVFQLDGKEYGISVQYAYGIEKVPFITRVPGTAPFVKGVINLRGVIIPVLDLRKRLKLEECPYSESTRIIIAAYGDIEVGLIVDNANDVIDISEDMIEPSPEFLDIKEDENISGIVKMNNRLLILLDLAKIIDPEKLIMEG